ncbi:MAG: hypothetical protein IJ366_02030, partial [Clostridia bacterium]|nr:hypothetical protein [Clostridia bacterium]
MSERQAKKLRKEQPEVKKAAVKKSSAGANAIFAVIIVAFLAVGGYAVVNHYQVNNPKQPSTVEDFAEEAGITTEEFLAKYGLDANEEINGDTDIYTAMNAMTVAKYAEYNGTTVEALAEEYAFSSDVTADTLWSDAQMYVPMSKVLEMSG